MHALSVLGIAGLTMSSDREPRVMVPTLMLDPFEWRTPLPTGSVAEVLSRGGLDRRRSPTSFSGVIPAFCKQTNVGGVCSGCNRHVSRY